MRMVSSSGKSTGKRRAICSGLQALPIADPVAARVGGLSRPPSGREQPRRPEPQRRLSVVPPQRFATPRSAQASSALGDEQRVQRAIALLSRDTLSRRFGWRRCAATLVRASRPLAQAGAQPPAWTGPAREGVRSPRAPQTRDTGRKAAWLMV